MTRTPRARSVTGLAYLPDRSAGPGRLAEVTLHVTGSGPAHLDLPEVTVRDERPGVLLANRDLPESELRFDPSGGGGPVSSPEHDLSARAFGLVNVAYHAQRALRAAAGLLGRDLPHLLIRIGMHSEGRGWSGGHYRVPTRRDSEREPVRVAADGEVHLGGGARWLPPHDPGGHSGHSGYVAYFAVPSHNAAIVYHEVGHHVCQHTADFRLNRWRSRVEQTNKKVAVEEGTADVFAAIMLDDPDIYRWHRGDLPESDLRRRSLAPRWTMAQFQGGSADPHADGTVWASACWSARLSVVGAGHHPSRFDRMLLRGLERSAELSARNDGGEPIERVLRRRRYLSGLLAGMLAADPDLAAPVLAGMASRGIEPGGSNAELRDQARDRSGTVVDERSADRSAAVNCR